LLLLIGAVAEGHEDEISVSIEHIHMYACPRSSPDDLGANRQS
jgi:hypothetical protein